MPSERDQPPSVFSVSPLTLISAFISHSLLLSCSGLVAVLPFFSSTPPPPPPLSLFFYFSLPLQRTAGCFLSFFFFVPSQQSWSTFPRLRYPERQQAVMSGTAQDPSQAASVPLCTRSTQTQHAQNLLLVIKGQANCMHACMCEPYS